MTCLLLVVLAAASLTASACGGEQHQAAGADATGRGQIEVTSTSGDCLAGWPGPWTACREADWAQQIAERAGYRITGETGSALIAEGNGRSFYIWTTEVPTEEVTRAAKRDRWQLLGTVAAVEVYGDETLWRWWPAQGYVVWLQAGPSSDSRAPRLEELRSLVRASNALPPPR
jgi:hypothetical protein